MSRTATVDVPVQVIYQLQELLAALETRVSPYQATFLARMYRARASDLEGKGRNLPDVKSRVHHASR